MGVRVDRSLHRSEHARHRLPLVEQHRLGQVAQGRVGVGREGGCLGLAVETHRARRPASGARRLARRPGADHHQGRELREELVDKRVEESLAVGQASISSHLTQVKVTFSRSQHSPDDARRIASGYVRWSGIRARSSYPEVERAAKASAATRGPR